MFWEVHDQKGFRRACSAAVGRKMSVRESSPLERYLESVPVAIQDVHFMKGARTMLTVLTKLAHQITI